MKKENEMGMIKLCSEGSWWLRSKEDPRWNYEGSGTVGGLIIPSECKDKIKELKKRLGTPPDDLEFGYMKD